MLAGPLRVASAIASLIVIVSFGLFALDETRAASERSAAETAGLQAVRTADPASGLEQHGFLNVLLATGAGLSGASAGDSNAAADYRRVVRRFIDGAASSPRGKPATART